MESRGCYDSVSAIRAVTGLAGIFLGVMDCDRNHNRCRDDQADQDRAGDEIADAALAAFDRIAGDQQEFIRRRWRRRSRAPAAADKYGLAILDAAESGVHAAEPELTALVGPYADWFPVGLLNDDRFAGQRLSGHIDQLSGQYATRHQRHVAHS